MSAKVLTGGERTSLSLRTLYQKYGYLPYKMSKFEAYDLYVENKEFLVGDGVITFHDTDGRLMALKPDVTLSIIKNGVDEGKRKVYYDERVYRISAKTKQFREIQQVGLECVGDIDGLDVYETVRLAAESLAAISPDYLLNLSPLGIVSALLKEIGGGESFEREAMQALSEKNAHEMASLCNRYAVGAEAAQKLLTLLSAYGETSEVLEKIRPLCNGGAREAFRSFEELCVLLQKTEFADKIRVDFSVDGDMHYYDDVVFKGYVQGIGEGILSGGRYDKLLSRMGRSSGAIGFAVYLDLLEGFGEEKESIDVDVLLLYDEHTDTGKLLKKAEALRAEGKSVRMQRSAGGIRYGEREDLTGGKA